MNPSITVILFDLGGVLVELDGPPIKKEWLPKPMDDSEIWGLCAKSSAIHDFERGRINSKEFGVRMVDEFSLSVSPEDYLEFFTYWPTGLFLGVEELLSKIPLHYRKAIFSNTSEAHWTRLMNEMNLAHHIQHCYASFQIGHVKPDTKGFEIVIEKLNVAAEEILFLDDNQANVEAAKNCGIQSIWVRGVVEVEEALKTSGVIPRT